VCRNKNVRTIKCTSKVKTLLKVLFYMANKRISITFKSLDFYGAKWYNKLHDRYGDCRKFGNGCKKFVL